MVHRETAPVVDDDLWQPFQYGAVVMKLGVLVGERVSIRGCGAWISN